MSSLQIAERPSEHQPEGLLVLHHGRGTSEMDLLPLADMLDPDRRLHVAAPRAPLQLPGSPGYHWYLVPRVGYPDPNTFWAAREALAELHDELWAQTGLGPEQTVLGGFSMGTVMSYALGLSADRPAPGGIMAFSGFIPTIEGWEPPLHDPRRHSTRVFITHGRHDPIIEVDFGRAAHEALESAGFDTTYVESEAAHNIEPAGLRSGTAWLHETLALTAS